MPQVKLLVLSDNYELVSESTTLELSQELYGYMRSQVPLEWERDVTVLAFEKAIPLSGGNRQKLQQVALQCKRLHFSRPGEYPDGGGIDQVISRLADRRFSYLQLCQEVAVSK